VIGGFIAYWVWPPSQAYLYRQAEALMKSSKRHDWITARDEYLEPLDRRFPDNPYREQTQKWRDRILLDEAENRGEVLTAGVKPFKEPNNNAERQYVITHTLAAEASARGDDLAAVRLWREMAQRLKSDAQDPQAEDAELEQRKWYLLALRRAEQVEHAIQ